MTDRREMILARLFELLGSLPGVQQCVRNRGELPNDLRPAITLLDCDENVQSHPARHGGLSAALCLVSLEPEIYLLLETRKPDNVGVGQDLNLLRAVIIKAILTDTVLIALVGTNGEIKYNGCVTDLAKGRAMDGEMGLNFALVYVLNPREL
jgi:hypothetical protein